MKRNSHTAAQRTFIVKHLAGFAPPRAIVAAFCAVYPEATCNENDILATDPETTLVSPELLAAFKAERERVLLDPTSATYANKAARLIALSNHAKFYAGNNQFPEMRSVLRHIAEETGDLVTGGKGGGKAGTMLTPQEAIAEIRVTYVDPAPPEPVAT